MVPNQEFSPFRINPFKTWLVVVAVSGLSYASYLRLKIVKGRGGIVIATACNNLLKGGYACFFARNKAGLWSLILLTGLVGIGLLPVLWI